MEQLISVLMTLIIINCAIKLSFWRWWQAGIFSLAAAAFTIAMCPYAITQSKTQIADYLENTAALQDMAIVITLESALGFFFCVTYLRGLYGKRNPLWARALWWYPSLLVFPVLFCCLTEMVFTLTGVSFSLTSYITAAAVLTGLPLLAWAMRRLAPDGELRIELHFLITLLVCVMGLLSTVNGRTVYAAVESHTDPGAAALAALIFVVTFSMGFAWERVRFPLMQRMRERRRKRRR